MHPVSEIIQDAIFGVVATVVDGKPKARPMSFIRVAGNRLWSSTYAGSGKVKEFQQNPNVEVCFIDSKKVQARIEGFVDLTGGLDKKKKLLEINPQVGRHFSGENDPNFIHIELVPTRVRWKEAGFGEYKEIPVD